MSKDAYEIGLAFDKAPPPTIEAGGAFSCAISVMWPKEREPKETRYALRKGDDVLQEGALPGPDAEGAIALALRAPEDVGEHRLTIAIAGEDEEGTPAEGALPFSLATLPHDTSLAVWDVPSPVVRGAEFEIKAGAKCSVSCVLAGTVIDIRDEAGKLIGSGALGEAVLEGTTALYFATITLKAPRKRALHSWTASFAPSELKLAHVSATARFSFVTAAEPEHSVSVKVINKETKAPIAGAHVRLGVYRAQTDASGAAKVRVPKGAFPLVVTRVGYKMPERTLEVEKDLRVRIAADQLPPEDPFALWTA